VKLRRERRGVIVLIKRVWRCDFEVDEMKPRLEVKSNSVTVPAGSVSKVVGEYGLNTVL